MAKYSTLFNSDVIVAGKINMMNIEWLEFNLLKASALIMLALLFAGTVCQTVNAASDDVVDIADRNQVFIDGRYVQNANRVTLRVCPPKKTGEICIKGSIGGYSQIMEPDGVFRGFSYLTKDGIHWRSASGELPEPDDILGVRFGGETVFVDPNAPDDLRYKRIDGMRNKITASSDGINWTDFSTGIFPSAACYPYGMDSQNVCFFDPSTDQYTAYVRKNNIYTCPDDMVWYYGLLGADRYGATNHYARRTIARSTSNSLESFPLPEIVMEPDDDDPMFNGCRVMDFYCPQVVRYPYAQDAYWLFNCRYFSYEDWYLPIDMSGFTRATVTDPVDGVRKPIGTYNAGVEDIELDASRDGIQWLRYERKPWIAQGENGSFDALNMYMTRGMYLHDDEIWMYYIGINDPHTGSAEVQDQYTFSRVVLRKDGFTCVEADYGTGTFTTCPLTFTGNQLTLNIQTSALGLGRVEIQNSEGTPITGFALQDCDRIFSANTTAHTVTWNGSSDVSALAGQTIRLHFEITNHTKLYAFTFGEPMTNPSGVLISYTGNADPTEYGWTYVHDNAAAGLVTGNATNDSGTLAWWIRDLQSVSSGGESWFYEGANALSDNDFTNMVEKGFTLSATVRVDDSIANGFDETAGLTPGLQFALQPLRLWYLLKLGINAEGNTQYEFLSGSSSTSAKSGILTGSGYHTYVLKYDAESDTLDLLIDNTEVLSDHQGHSTESLAAALKNRIRWGSQDSPGIGAGFWSHVLLKVPVEGTSILVN